MKHPDETEKPGEIADPDVTIDSFASSRPKSKEIDTLNEFAATNLGDSIPIPPGSETHKSVEVLLGRFRVMKVLGEGAFGKVFLVEKKTTILGKKNKLYAMKVLRKELIMAKNQYEHTMTERRVLEELESPFIVKLAYAF